MLGELPSDERQLLRAAHRWADEHDQHAPFGDLLPQVVGQHGMIDFSTAVLFDQFARRHETAGMLERYRSIESAAASRFSGRLAVVPGIFYREYPHTGADGQLIRDVAQRHGWSTDLVPIESYATSQTNGRLLCEWLLEQQSNELVLVSLSKGGADVKAALALDDAPEAFANVHGWVNLGGMLDGSPMAEWVCQRPLARAYYRMLFRLLGHDFAILQSLQRSAQSATDGRLQLPSHMQVLHVLGFPLQKHLSSRRARRWHRRLAAWGPNDSVMLLADALNWPGTMFPVWGTDHYLQQRWDPQQLIPFLLNEVVFRNAAIGC